MTRHMPWPRRDIVRSELLKRWPTATLSANAVCALSGSPPDICAEAFQVRSHAFSANRRSPRVPSTAREPSQRGCDLASEHQTRPNQDGVPSAAPRIVATDGFVVSERPRLVMAGQVRGRCELVEIVEFERRSGVRLHELPGASPHERWATDARACSSTPIVVTGPVCCVLGVDGPDRRSSPRSAMIHQHL
jgi:hypothetical protein